MNYKKLENGPLITIHEQYVWGCAAYCAAIHRYDRDDEETELVADILDSLWYNLTEEERLIENSRGSLSEYGWVK
jgi:hypothetical protein